MDKTGKVTIKCSGMVYDCQREKDEQSTFWRVTFSPEKENTNHAIHGEIWFRNYALTGLVQRLDKLHEGLNSA